MAAKSDGVLKMKKGSDVAFTPLQNSEHSGSVQGLAPGSSQLSSGDGGSRCCCSGGGGGRSAAGVPVASPSLCLRLAREQPRYSLWDCLWILAAATVYLADVGSDVWLAADYFLRGHRWWFGLTLFFVLLGSLTVQLFSFRWFAHDFSTGNSSAATGPTDAKTNPTGAAGQEGDPRGPVTPLRQKANPGTPAAATANAGPNPGTRAPPPATTTASSSSGSSSCAFCIWILQSLVHILQLGQFWRVGCRRAHSIWSRLIPGMGCMMLLDPLSVASILAPIRSLRMCWPAHTQTPDRSKDTGHKAGDTTKTTPPGIWRIKDPHPGNTEGIQQHHTTHSRDEAAPDRMSPSTTNPVKE